jgi:hypothetical protein
MWLPHFCDYMRTESAVVLWAIHARLDAAPQRGAGSRGRIEIPDPPVFF